MRHFYGFIAFMSQEFWPGLSENLFGRKPSFKLYETWYFWGVKLGLYKLYCFPLSHTCLPPKNVRSRDLELNKDTPLLTRLCFWLKRGPSTASTPAWWMLGGGFAIFGIKYHRRSSRSWFHVVAALPSSFWTMQAIELLRLRRDKSARHARLYPGSFLGYISHSRFSLK